MTSSAAAGSPQGADEEYRIKAAFMYHFLQLVEWPAEAIGNNSAIVLCTIGDDPFQGGLEEAMNGKTARSRAIHVRHLKRSDDPHACHAIFLDGNDSKVTQQSITALKNDPVLTVGDGDAFLQSGGMIRFIKEDNKVRFEINLRAAEQAKIRISSRLLLLAKTVIGKPGET